MYPFSFHQKKTVAETVTTKSNHADTKFLAGGQSLIGVMKLRLDKPSHLINLDAIPELRGIHVDGKTLTIGAMTRHAEVASYNTRPFPTGRSYCGSNGSKYGNYWWVCSK